MPFWGVEITQPLDWSRVQDLIFFVFFMHLAPYVVTFKQSEIPLASRRLQVSVPFSCLCKNCCSLQQWPTAQKNLLHYSFINLCCSLLWEMSIRETKEFLLQVFGSQYTTKIKAGWNMYLHYFLQKWLIIEPKAPYDFWAHLFKRWIMLSTR